MDSTLSTGTDMANRPVVGSVTSAEFTTRALRCSPLPSILSSPSEPRTIPGTRGSVSVTVAGTLPLVPGIVRGSDGELKIEGSGEQRSALVVNSADVTDPTTGRFAMSVPVDSVESISVYQTPFLAEYGRFTSGVATVETRRGGEKWHFELNDPLPGVRISSWHLRGLRDETPQVSFGGP